MADKKISQLTEATTPLSGTETLPIVQEGNTVKATVQNVLGYVVNDSTNNILKTMAGGNNIGLNIDFANGVYVLGDYDGVFGSNAYFKYDFTNNTMKAVVNSGYEGLFIDGTSQVHKIGLSPGNNSDCFIGVDVQNQTLITKNTTQASAGSTSGEYLKINVGGTDYVIELFNAS